MGQGPVVTTRKQRGLKTNIESIREKAEGSVSIQSHRPGARVNTLEGPEFPKSTFLLECPFPILLASIASKTGRKNYVLFNTLCSSSDILRGLTEKAPISPFINNSFQYNIN